MMARNIGALIGQVMEVDQNTKDDCVGRFLRVQVRFDVEQPLMRGAFLGYPGEGSQ